MSLSCDPGKGGDIECSVIHNEDYKFDFNFVYFYWICLFYFLLKIMFNSVYFCGGASTCKPDTSLKQVPYSNYSFNFPLRAVSSVNEVSFGNTLSDQVDQLNSTFTRPPRNISFYSIPIDTTQCTQPWKCSAS